MQAPENTHGEYRQDACADYELRPFAGTFRLPDIERTFQLHHLAQTKAQLSIALGVCGCFYVAFALSDVAALGYTRETLILFLARLLVAFTAAAGIYRIARYPQSISMPRLAATTVEVVGLSAFMLVVVYRPGEIAWHAMSMNIMLIVVYLFIPNALLNVMAVAVATTIVFTLLILTVGALSVSDGVTVTMLLVLTNTIGIVAARRNEHLWRREFRAQSVLRTLSLRDHLTGCYNRRYIEEYLLDREIERASRYPAWLTVVMCDLDHFKAVNDTYGHRAGDAVLQHFAVLLQTICREHVDSVIRYGGEEFLLVLPETDLNSGTKVAERLRAAIAENPAYRDGTQTVMITASFGVASVDFSVQGHGVSPQDLITKADELLYRAKNAGRNCVKFAELSRDPVAL
jgi:diguanylate cyclase (GGDEF)-like protein